jgi:hypothetical protein
MTLSKMKLPLSFDAFRLREDAALFDDTEWTPHFNVHNYEGEWSVVPLRAVKGARFEIYPDPNAPAGYVETAQMSRCVYVPEVLNSFQCKLQTVRFLKLAAGSQIRRHRDYALGLEDGFIRIHVPVATNDQVEFMLADERVEMREGEAWYLNVNFHHSVRNNGGTDRIHLVIDCVVNDWLRAFFH